jgi:hypothetical protein
MNLDLSMEVNPIPILQWCLVFFFIESEETTHDIIEDTTNVVEISLEEFTSWARAPMPQSIPILLVSPWVLIWSITIQSTPMTHTITSEIP